MVPELMFDEPRPGRRRGTWPISTRRAERLPSRSWGCRRFGPSSLHTSTTVG